LAPEKVVLLEMQVHHAFGFDSFIKVAHMAGGYHIFHDARTNPRNKAPHADIGIILNEQTIAEMVDLCMSVYKATHSDRRTISVSAPRSSPLTSRQLLSEMKTLSPDNVFVYPSRWSSSEALDNITLITTSASSDSFSTTTTNTKTDPNNNIAIEGPKLHHKYWLFPPPEYSNITKASILGPTLADNERHCKLLPYYYFRLWTMPVKEHKYQCDRNKIFTKASGRIVDKLLSEFV